MNTLETIRARKSTRNFLTQPIEKEKLETIVEAGNAAAKAAGALDFMVISNADRIHEIQQTAKAVMLQSGNEFLIIRANTPDFEVLYNAATAIAVVVDASQEPNTMGMNTANAACAAENMLLAATELGVSSCYTVSSALAFMAPNIKTAYGLGDEKTIACIVALGYSADEPTKSFVERNRQNTKWFE